MALVFSFNGNCRQIYNWNATQGLGCAPALSWLPYIQSGIPVHNACSHDWGGGQTYIAMLASEDAAFGGSPTRPV